MYNSIYSRTVYITIPRSTLYFDQYSKVVPQCSGRIKNIQFKIQLQILEPDIGKYGLNNFTVHPTSTKF